MEKNLHSNTIINQKERFKTWEEQVKFLKSNNNKDSSDQQETTFLENTEANLTIVLSSYPRSGNTLVRSHLEKLTGIYTGSDCDLKRNLNRQLFEMGLKGEGTIDKSVLVVKTHFPERLGLGEFTSSKVIVIVRNPLDCLASLFNMIATVSHSTSIKDKTLAKTDKIWKEFVT